MTTLRVVPCCGAACTTTALALRVRVAGGLVLMFGIPVSTIARLTSKQIHGTDGATTVALNPEHPLLVPPQLGVLLRRLAEERPLNLVHVPDSDPGWVFRGRSPGRHVSGRHLARTLRDHGIPARIAHNTALIALAGDLPSAILADTVGMQPRTATEWAKQAQPDWAHYIAARSDSPRGR